MTAASDVPSVGTTRVDVRLSTAFVLLALLSGAVGALGNWLDNEKIARVPDAAILIPLWALFPSFSVLAAVTSLGYLIARRRWQHLLELAVALLLLLWLSTWEFF
jgi:hypothetical protein